MSTIALIPARGGSKRLPRKNMLEIGGLPMLAHPIQTALRSSLFDRVFVSTEDSEIAEIAHQYGAEIIERPMEIAQDRSTVAQVCLHALELHPEVSHLCCIYATAITLKPESIIAARSMMNEEPTADFVMGVSNYEHPPVQALKMSTNGYLQYMWPEWLGIQSQFQPHLVVSNGSFYWVYSPAFKREKTFYGQRLKGYVLPHDQVSDINTPEDFENIRKSFQTAPN